MRAATPENALAALLHWYVACGVDIAVDDKGRDRFAASARPARADGNSPETPPSAGSHAESPPARQTGASPLFADDAARAAQETASAAADVADLRGRLENFKGCALVDAASHFVFAAGTPGARVMVVDLIPGEHADRSGEAFIGVEGRLIDNMLAAIGLDRNTAYLAYLAPWRSPGGRDPYPLEMAALLPFARRHVELAAPEILLILGENAAKAMQGANEPGAPARGEWFDFPCGGANVRAMPLYGVGSLLNSPGLKRTAWRDLRVVAAALR
ncbi:MAG: uracil-DNA glycosylase [Methylocystis sp.]|nr:uracil-DNA glycosylase [Methylocystis sp.]MBI3275697.1 uracil-DNA glycosylase [Methylocystis sp.]